MMPDECRAEIDLRIDRETQYILAIAERLSNEDAIKLLKEKIEDNNVTLRLLGNYLEGRGNNWEKFYRENYWEKKNV